MPNAAPETTVCPARASSAPIAGGEVGAVGRGGPRADDRDGVVELVQPHGPAHPEPERRAAALLDRLDADEVVEPAAATPRRRGPRSGCRVARPARARARGPSPPAARRRRRAARRRRAPTRDARGPAWRRAPRPDRPCGGRRARSAWPGRPGPGARRRRRGGVHPARLSRVAISSGAPDRSRRATSTSVRPGRSTPARSATVQASRWTRVAPRPLSRPAYSSSSRRRCASSVSGHSSRSSGPGVWELSRQLRPA